MRRNEVSVEAGVLGAEGRAGGQAETKPIAGAVRVRAQREVAGERVDVLCAQLRIAAEAACCQHCRASLDAALLAIRGDDLRAAHTPMAADQRRRLRAQEDLAGL